MPGVIAANVPPRVAAPIVDKPTTVMVTFVPAIPEANDVVTVGAPSMVKVAIALSVGVFKVRFTMYTPAAAFGTENVVVPAKGGNEEAGNDPVAVTVGVTAEDWIKVVPW